MELIELAERCEKAEGPSRDLDGLVHARLNPDMRIIVGEKPGRFPREPIYGVPGDLIAAGFNLPDLADYISAPAYTASIDAAMTLATGHAVLITLSEIKGDGMPHCVFGNPGTSELFEAVADTMPLALCAAALRAIASVSAPSS